MNNEALFARNWRETVFLVEATDFERLTLWNAWANDPIAKQYGPPNEHRVPWEEESLGSLSTVGTIKEFRVRRRPICVSTTWAIILRCRVAFFNATSQVVDHLVVDAWLATKCNARWDHGMRPARSDAMNFHHCIDALRERAAESRSAP